MGIGKRQSIFNAMKDQHKSKILFIATIYETYPIIVPALLEQTYKNWELMLVHDGPSKRFNYRKLLDYHNDL